MRRGKLRGFSAVSSTSGDISKSQARSHPISVFLNPQIEENEFDYLALPPSFKSFSGSNYLVCLVKVETAAGNPTFVTEVMYFKKNPEVWAKLYLLKSSSDRYKKLPPQNKNDDVDSGKEDEERRKNSALDGYFLEYINQLTDRRVQFSLRNIESITEDSSGGGVTFVVATNHGSSSSSSSSNSSPYEPTAFARRRRTRKYHCVLSFKFPSKQSGLLKMLRKIHDYIHNNPKDEKREYDLFDATNYRVLPTDKRRYRDAIRKSFPKRPPSGQKEVNILRTHYTQWNHQDFQIWLSCLPYETRGGGDEQQQQKDTFITTTMLDILNSKKMKPSLLTLLEKYLFGEKNYKKKDAKFVVPLMTLKMELERTSFFELINQQNDEQEQQKKKNKNKNKKKKLKVDPIFRNIHNYLKKYLTILEFCEPKDGTWSFTFQKVLMKYISNEKNAGGKSNNKKDKKGVHEILNWMMKDKIILWDANECRDHIIALMFFDHPFINFDHRDTDVTFGEAFQDLFWEEIKKTKKLLQKNQNQNKNILHFWKHFRDKYFDYHSIEFEDDEEETLKSLFEGEDEFVSSYLGLPGGANPKEVMDMKFLIDGKKWGFRLDRIDYNFYSRMHSLETSLPLWDTIIHQKNLVLELDRKIQNLEDEKKKKRERKKKKKNKKKEKQDNKCNISDSDTDSDSDILDFDFDFDNLETLDFEKLKKWTDKNQEEMDEEESLDEKIESSKTQLIEILTLMKKQVPALIELVKYGIFNSTIFSKIENIIPNEEEEEETETTTIITKKMTEWEFLRSRNRRLEIHKILRRRIREVQTTSGGALEIIAKLVLSELHHFSDLNPTRMQIQRLFLSTLSRLHRFGFYSYGFCHSSLILKNVQFHWYANQFINIKHLRGEKNPAKEFFCVNCFCPLVASGYDFFELMDVMVRRILVYNTFTPYDVWGLSQSKKGPKNCQQVTTKLLEKLGCCDFFDVTKKYFEEVEKTINRKIGSSNKENNNNQNQKKDEDDIEIEKEELEGTDPKLSLRVFNLSWCPEFANDKKYSKAVDKLKIDLLKNLSEEDQERIVFKKHSEIDKFLNDLCRIDSDFPYDYPQVFETIKGIDRAFWLNFAHWNLKERVLKKMDSSVVEKRKRILEIYKPMENGCPFNHILEMNDEKIDEEEEEESSSNNNSSEDEGESSNSSSEEEEEEGEEEEEEGEEEEGESSSSGEEDEDN